MERSKMGLLRRLAVCAIALVLVHTYEARPARADSLWQTTKDYSADLAKTALAGATAAVAAARVVVTQRTAELAAARATAAAVANTARAASAAAAVAEAEAALIAAEAALASATTALEAATAVAAGIAGGTLIGEGVDWLISVCWDPVCDLTAANAAYRAPTDAEIDRTVEIVLRSIDTGDVQLTRESFAGSDQGAAAWAFLRDGARVFLVAARGAAAHTAGNREDVSRAAADLRAALDQYIQSTATFSEVAASTRLFGGDAIPALQKARAKVDVVRENARGFADPATAGKVYGELSTSLEATIGALQSAADRSGAGRPLEGGGGYFPALSREDFLKFLEDVKAKGPSALPPGEVSAIEQILGGESMRFADGRSPGEHVAAYIAEGDTGNEAALFAAGPLPPSRIFQTALDHHWRKIDLAQSPLMTGGTTATPPTPITPTKRGCGGCAGTEGSGASLALFALVALLLGRRRDRART